MRKIILISLLIILICGTCYAETKEAKWEYVVSRDGLIYSVDMNSVDYVFGNILLFWVGAQDNDKDRISLAPLAIKVESREFRSEEFYVYNSKTKELLSSVKKPSDWKPIGKNSPIELIVNYVFEHDPRFAPH